jgi:DMSO/TMAO reductase YedYZ molybdopterin-dependent catalytic subunit
VVDGTPVGRRVFLGMVGLGAAGVLWGSKAAGLFERLMAPVAVKDGSGLLGLFPVGRFRIYSVAGFLPGRSDTEYRLRIAGLVDRPLELTLADLKAMAPTRLTADFQCVTGWRVPGVDWAGVRLGDLLERAGVKAEAGGVEFTSFDGIYTESLTLEQARRRDVLVAYQLDGKRISSAHGGPVRLYVAPMYGYKSCKWLDAMEVVARPEPGYWEQRSYDVDAWVGRSNGRSDEPTT